jgi:hypothetical protein
MRALQGPIAFNAEVVDSLVFDLSHFVSFVILFDG